MIVRMKKITILVSEKDREKFVSRLRKEGLLHVKHVQSPAHHEITFIEDKISVINKMINQLRPYYDPKLPDRRNPQREREHINAAGATTEECRGKRELESGLKKIKKQMQWYDVWGKFSPEDLEKIKEAGLNVKIYVITTHQYKDLDPGENYRIIKKEKGYVYLALISKDPEEGLPVKEETVPDKSYRKLEEAAKETQKRIDAAADGLRNRARSFQQLKNTLAKLQKELEFQNVKFGMKEEGRFSYIQGFCPEKKLPRIISLAKKLKSGYLVEDPDDPDETPTLITNPKWIKIINPVFQFMNTLPGYKEFDISFPFLAFFSLFFAMLIGDAGYGVLFLVGTFIARQRLKKLPWEPFFLMYLLSIGTIVWGAITGTWFGAEKIQELPFLHALVIPNLSSFSDTNQDFIIHLCFIIGAVQLTLAHIMKAARVINSLKALSDVGWIMIIWGMFFTAGTLIAGKHFPSLAVWLFAVGLVLTLFFSNPEKGILKGIPVTLVNLPLSVIGSFSDIVSYIRLFAVGMATVIVAESFNNMALAGGINSILSGLIAALILFFGHMLNIILGFMAVIVHGVRLNMLEFSGHLGMEWSGKKYKPFGG